MVGACQDSRGERHSVCLQRRTEKSICTPPSLPRLRALELAVPCPLTQKESVSFASEWSQEEDLSNSAGGKGDEDFFYPRENLKFLSLARSLLPTLTNQKNPLFSPFLSTQSADRRGHHLVGLPRLSRLVRGRRRGVRPGLAAVGPAPGRRARDDVGLLWCVRIFFNFLIRFQLVIRPRMRGSSSPFFNEGATGRDFGSIQAMGRES